MNKTAIRNYAVWARGTLIKACTQKAFELGITAENCKNRNTPKSAQVLKPNGQPLSSLEQGQRDALLQQVSTKGFEQVMEEAAYTWFNRFIALKYMQEHSLLPLAMKALPGRDGGHSEILSQALKIQLDGLEREKVYTLLERSDSEGLYKTLLIALCNSLSESLPRMFEAISNYTELLFPDGLLKPDSVLSALSTDILEADWQSIEIVGWLYQFYNTELKDETFALLKKNVKISKERIGAATQLFTPEWIVKYMVENSLGRLIYEQEAGSREQRSEEERVEWEKAFAEKLGWKYYLPEAEQTPEVRAQLSAAHSSLLIENIKLIDPCMGSGHILVYAFDLLMGTYRSQGYTDRDAVESIVRNNLYGLDIDDRAAQLAYFAVMMKAAQYDSHFLSRGVQPNLFALQESNGLAAFNELYGQMDLSFTYVQAANDLIEQFRDAKVYGSLIDVQMPEIPESFMERLQLACMKHLQTADWFSKARDTLPALIDQARLLSRQYDVVVTNPPYMGSSGMDAKLAEYVKAFYPDSKSDLFACFIEKCSEMTRKNGCTAMITQHAWMFLSSYEKLREKMLETDILNMMHLGPRAFEEIGGEVVQSTCFVLRKSHAELYHGVYARLVEPTTQQRKEDLFLSSKNRYVAEQTNFSKIPGSPIAYWLCDNVVSAFTNFEPISHYAITRRGLQTGNAPTFIRFWYEVSYKSSSFGFNDDIKDICELKWFPFNSGGNFRRWFGNIVNVVNWQDNGKLIKSTNSAIIPSEDKYFSRVITWNKVSSGKLSVRYQTEGIIPGDASPFLYVKDLNSLLYFIAVLNSSIVELFLEIISPTLNFEVGHIAKIPIIIAEEEAEKQIIKKSLNCIEIAKIDWDLFETSWDFKRHPML